MSFDRIHFRFSSDSAPTFKEEPRRDQSVTEGNNITLEWKYRFGGGSFRQMLFKVGDLTIADKLSSDKVPYIALVYRSRLLANVTSTYTSITLLRVNDNDTKTYTLEIVESETRERAVSQVEILVGRKYRWQITYFGYKIYYIA